MKPLKNNPPSAPKAVRRTPHYLTGAEQAAHPENQAEKPDALPQDEYGYPEDYEPPKKGGAALVVAIVAAVVITLAVAGFLAYIFFFNPATETDAAPTTVAATVPSTEEAATTQPLTENEAARLFTMPDVTGLSEADAYKKLNESGVRYRIIREYSDSVARGYVIAQTPDKDAQLMRSEEAVVRLSKGKENDVVEFTTNPKKEKSTDSTESTKPASAKHGTDGYLLPDSDSKYLSKSDLSSLSQEELNLALNEIFARRGRIFSDPSIKAYFNAQSWYHGTISPADFDSSVLNQYELHNINLIIGYQTELGYR